MKVLLIAVNAKYIHSNPAVYILKRYAADKIMDGIEIDIAEYTINNYEDQIISDIYTRKPDLLAFSCYIWNISIIKDVIKEYKKINKNIIIWLGGPEAYNDYKRLMDELGEIDGIIIGEGEETFARVLNAYKKSNLYYFATLTAKAPDISEAKSVANNQTIPNKIHDHLNNIPGITYRKDSKERKEYKVNPYNQPLNLSLLPFPYEELDESLILSRFENRIIYYESSRGCPFSCSYCLSSIDKAMRYKEIEQVYKELGILLLNRVKQVKFIDRTFNCKSSHAISILRYILENDNNITNFHFEIAADLLNEEEIDLLKKMRPGLIQLEIGIQSTNIQTLTAVNRKMDIEKAFSAIRKIKENKNVHQHLDLIAGLPYEDYESFKKSFNTIYALLPEQLQLGFLKVLKGSPLEKCVDEYGIVYKDKPPYEVLYTKWINYDGILKLKGIEEMVEVYYNSRQFKHALMYISNWFITPFDMYEALSDYYERQGLNFNKHNRVSRYKILYDFFLQQLEKDTNLLYDSKGQAVRAFLELLEYDMYLRENMKNRPIFLLDKQDYKDKIKKLYEKEGKRGKYKDSFHIGYFSILLESASEKGIIEEKESYILFDYSRRDAIENDAAISILYIIVQD